MIIVKISPIFIEHSAVFKDQLILLAMLDLVRNSLIRDDCGKNGIKISKFYKLLCFEDTRKALMGASINAIKQLK